MIVGTTYWPADVGPYLWHEFDRARVAADFRLLRTHGVRTVRVLLSWDVFMRSHRAVSRRRLADLDSLLNAAKAASLGVVPVVFGASLGGCVMLPPYAVDRRARTPGVRVIDEARVVPGAPRDIYADPLMLETEVRYLDALLDGFANHPAITAWDLAHDPAATLRPRRIEDMVGWAELMGGRIRDRQDRCWLTLGARDVITARGVRLGRLAGHVDGLGISVGPDVMDEAMLARDQPAAVMLFLFQMAQRLAGGGVPVLAQPELAQPDSACSPGEPQVPSAASRSGADAVVRIARQLVEGLAAAGVAGALPWPSTAVGPRALDAPPLDRELRLGAVGLLDCAGDLTAQGSVWTAWMRSNPAVGPPSPWPTDLDIEQFYANLPDSLGDLYAMWRGGPHGRPGIVG